MIRFEDVSKVYDDGTVAVDHLDLEIPTGQLLALVGPSGCGKTTSLRMINRLVDLSDGRILLDDLDITSIDRVTLRRKIGYVIQHAGLFPHRTIVDNVAALPQLLGGDRRATRTRAMELLELVGLDSRFAKRYPWQLSGASSSASASPGRSRPTRRSCSWTSRSAPSTLSFARSFRTSSSACSATSARPS